MNVTKPNPLNHHKHPLVLRGEGVTSSPETRTRDNTAFASSSPLLKRMMLRVLHFWFWLRRGMTLGARALVRDGEGRIFLVRHSYLPGWHLPGGGVEYGQTIYQGMEMELREEGNIRLTGEAKLFGVYLNTHVSQRDHVALFLVEAFEQTAPRMADHEIVETGFFLPNALPEGTSAATRRRLAEVAGEADISPYW